ncbi:Crp/Fnr family transcriptional regulator [Candidatus Roizmanbacteria bacterium]|nr:Crp/Fnr family transcriptional regulator [Candidatus Roizmanbacteria bacterium]
MKTFITGETEKFFSRFDLKRFSKGTRLINPEQKLSQVYFLKKGFAREYAISPQGNELTLHIFAPGSFFPMTWTIANIDNRYFYEAVTPLEIYSAPPSKVLEFLKNRPEILFDLTRRILIGLDKLLLRTEYLAFNRAEARICSMLLYLSRHFDELPFTHSEIASFAAVSRETASRTLEKLQKRAIIWYKSRRIVIKNKEELKKLL